MRRYERIHGLHTIQKTRDLTQHDGSSRQRGRSQTPAQSTLQARIDSHVPATPLSEQRRHRDRLQLGRRTRTHNERRRECMGSHAG